MPHLEQVCADWNRQRSEDTRQTKAHAALTGCGQARRAGEAGFTLLELLVVIAILGLLIGLVAPAVLRQLGSARTSIARQSIERLGAILDTYKLDIGSYPTTDQGLAALTVQPPGVANWNGPYVKGNTLLDPWNHPYTWRNPSQRSGHDYDLCSAGQGGSDAEICNQ